MEGHRLAELLRVFVYSEVGEEGAALRDAGPVHLGSVGKGRPHLEEARELLCVATGELWCGGGKPHTHVSAIGRRAHRRQQQVLQPLPRSRRLPAAVVAGDSPVVVVGGHRQRRGVIVEHIHPCLRAVLLPAEENCAQGEDY